MGHPGGPGRARRRDEVEEAMDAWREAEELFRERGGEGFRAVAEHEAEAAPGE